MTIILGLDPSLAKFGVARWCDGLLGVDTIETKPCGDLPAVKARRWRAIVSQIWPMLTGPTGHVDPQTLVMVEQRIVPTNSSDGRTTGRASNALDLAELRGVLYYGLAARGVTIVEVWPVHVKKYATGRHTASKQEVLLAAERRLGSVVRCANDNEADALWLASMALHRYGSPLCELPVVQACVLDKVADWPRDFALPALASTGGAR